MVGLSNSRTGHLLMVQSLDGSVAHVCVPGVRTCQHPLRLLCVIQVLGIGCFAGQEEVRAAYLRNAVKHHPDRAGALQLPSCYIPLLLAAELSF